MNPNFRRRACLTAAWCAALAVAPVTNAADSSAAQNKAAVSVALRAPDAIPALTVAPATAEPLVLAAPPRDSAEEGQRRFGPVAAYLSEVLGRKVVYRHPTTWGGYQADMQHGAYDIVFDGPHFIGWRVAKLRHNALVKLPGDFVYTAVVRKDNAAVTQLRQLAGHKICAHAPPNLGTMIMYKEFDNPARQPVVIETDGYDKIYQALLDGKCDAAMLPLKHVQKHDPNGERVRIVFKNQPLPQQAVSAGPRLSAAEQTKVAEALLSPAAATPLAKLREAYGLGKGFVPAKSDEYAGLGDYLRDIWGYY
jgi:ABC-type phosphate/phosphonate transport system substrate-binding protein